MDARRIAELLPKGLVADVEQQYAAFSADNGPDVVGFLADLHERKVISTAQLQDALATTKVSVAPPQSTDGVARYRRLGRIGKGSMGEVHLARDEELHRVVAIKCLKPRIAHNKRTARRFRTEVQITAQLDHPGIVPVYGWEPSAEHLPSYSMKLIRGRTLEVFLDETRKLHDDGRPLDEEHDLPARLELFLKICDAVSYAHARGVIHRDLKPGNVMIGAYHEVFVMDWGLARVVGEPGVLDPTEEDPDSEKTQHGSAIGTPAYMSPEQAQGLNDQLDGRSDQYALGLLLFEIVCLRSPITGRSGAETLVRAADGDKDPMRPYKGQGAIPRELVAIVDQATRYEPERRYRSVGRLAADVRRYLRDEPVSAAPDSLLERLARQVSRHRQATLVAVLVLLLLLVIGAVTLISGAGAVVAAQRYAANAREQRVGRVVAAVEERSHRIDGEFLADEGLLQGLVAAAELSLQRAPDDAPVYLDFKRSPPPDLVEAKGYGMQASTGFPDFAVAPTASGVDRQIRQLAGIQPVLLDVLVRSVRGDLPDPARQRQMVLDGAMPIVWSYAATEDGVLVALPGTGQYPAGYDPREQPWYQVAKGARRAVWGAASADESGMGLLVTCSQGLFAADGRFLGVAALDVSIRHLIDDLLEVPDVGAPVQAWLVDEDGQTIVQTGMSRNSPEPGPFDPALKARMDAVGNSGRIEATLPDGTPAIVIWTYLPSVRWRYVVEGPEQDLLGA